MRTRKLLRQRGYSQRVSNAAIKAYLKKKRESRSNSSSEEIKKKGQSSPEVSS